MAVPNAIGALEFSSIGVGYLVQDTLLKSADVEILIARTICSGKYFIVVGGSVSDVRTAIATGADLAADALVDELVIPNVDEQVFPALGQSVTLGSEPAEALGVVESFSGTSILEAADAACKAARVTLFRVHIAMALGGKGFCLMAGSLGQVRSAVQAAAGVVRQRGLLVSEQVIPRPRPELLAEYI